MLCTFEPPPFDYQGGELTESTSAISDMHLFTHVSPSQAISSTHIKPPAKPQPHTLSLLRKPKLAMCWTAATTPAPPLTRSLSQSLAPSVSHSLTWLDPGLGTSSQADAEFLCRRVECHFQLCNILGDARLYVTFPLEEKAEGLEFGSTVGTDWVVDGCCGTGVGVGVGSVGEGVILEILGWRILGISWGVGERDWLEGL